MFLTAGEQQTEGAVRVQDLSNIGNPDLHARAIFLCDGLKPLGLLEYPRPTLANLEANHRSLGDYIENGAYPVRSILLGKTSREPEAAIGSADERAAGVNGATLVPDILVDTRSPAELLEFVNSKQRAA
ncbi:MAG: hypothetical protein NZ990_02065 [Myxococcota bacterium]|nr:hypothetical protein [Myxococcota bacterium]